MSIIRFTGDYEFLSNFYPSTVWLDGVEYPTVEHAFQAAKTLDHEMRLKIQDAITPGGAKRIGRLVTLRPDWEMIKITIMEEMLRQKFHKHQAPLLYRKLIETGDQHLEEGNTWGDKFWGTCNGIGENHLGEILMLIRDDLS